MKLFQSFSNRDDAPEIRRERHDLVRRRLEVRAVERLTPHMIRITLDGPELVGFTSPSPDDHIKIFVPGLDGSPTRRDYTPRRYDPQNGTLLLDFVNHHGGPAAAWARAARPGDRLEIGGPRGSQIISGPIDHWLLIGDETALPAIGRRVEALSVRTSVTTVVAVPGAEDEQVFTTAAHHAAHWVHRPMERADDGAGILAVLKNLKIPDRTFVWVGAETHVAKAVRQYLLDERRIPAQWIKASGYWVKGQADASVKDFGDAR
ncbi:NADPH-dependent ferric siderophore reductase [Komagataeibacter oboediens]|uniref:NADPH-dependent ferric siderophore reductase n=1 Tax=Komagataeibacter oboediens TaxID=65958 RepID=A0A318QRX2_9PROT|nr:siderophore-interacting protein [Komagataeibacter oboediens]PYD77889.1 NADPH-dependent ferric siderophore reductase [Komagataeibacter oboediens]